jgi:hypothetical protein
MKFCNVDLQKNGKYYLKIYDNQKDKSDPIDFYDSLCSLDTWLKYGSGLADDKCLYLSTAYDIKQLQSKLL